MNIDLGYLITVLVVILVSMIFHELMHGVVAYALGDDTAKNEGRLTLNPIKHLDPFMSLLLPMLLALSGGPVFGGAKPVPINTRNLKWKEWGFALVAIAGPMTNLLLAFVGFLIGHFTGLVYMDMGFWSSFISVWVVVNLGFAVFNMIPVPPLDGSRVLYVFAPDFVRNFMMKLERYGMLPFLILFLLFSSVLSSYMGAAISAILDFFIWLVW